MVLKDLKTKVDINFEWKYIIGEGEIGIQNLSSTFNMATKEYQRGLMAFFHNL